MNSADALPTRAVALLRRPIRVQRRNTAGWRMPDNAVFVGKGSRWASPFTPGKTKVRMPGTDGTPWQYEGRSGKQAGEQTAFHHPDTITDSSGHTRYRVTWHQVEYATPDQCADMFRAAIEGTGVWARHVPTVADVRSVLAGRDLMCWCRLDEPCHADVLLAIANQR